MAEQELPASAAQTAADSDAFITVPVRRRPTEHEALLAALQTVTDPTERAALLTERLSDGIPGLFHCIILLPATEHVPLLQELDISCIGPLRSTDSAVLLSAMMRIPLPGGRTALHVAAEHNAVEAATWLLSHSFVDAAGGAGTLADNYGVLPQHLVTSDELRQLFAAHDLPVPADATDRKAAVAAGITAQLAAAAAARAAEWRRVAEELASGAPATAAAAAAAADTAAAAAAETATAAAAAAPQAAAPHGSEGQQQ